MQGDPLSLPRLTNSGDNLYFWTMMRKQWLYRHPQCRQRYIRWVGPGWELEQLDISFCPKTCQSHLATNYQNEMERQSTLLYWGQPLDGRFRVRRRLRTINETERNCHFAITNLIRQHSTTNKNRANSSSCSPSSKLKHCLRNFLLVKTPVTSFTCQYPTQWSKLSRSKKVLFEIRWLFVWTVAFVIAKSECWIAWFEFNGRHIIIRG